MYIRAWLGQPQRMNAAEEIKPIAFGLNIITRDCGVILLTYKQERGMDKCAEEQNPIAESNDR